MKVLNYFINPLRNISKGLVALIGLNLLIGSSVFIFNSCKKNEQVNGYNPVAKNQFLKAININKQKIGNIPLITKIQRQELSRQAPTSNVLPDEYQSIYIEVSPEIATDNRDLIFNVSSIQDLTTLVGFPDVSINYEPITGSPNHLIEVSVEAVSNSLTPLINESKQYLYSKGFTESDIQQMLIEENGLETDLIPFAMVLTQLENEIPSVAFNPFSFFISNTYARELTGDDFIRCGIVAIGLDFLYSAAHSTAKTWTISAMKKAFKPIVARMFGPVGVAIAVASFGICVAEAYFND